MTRIPIETLNDAVDAALRMIPPVWPLASSVAVNPFLGQTGETLAMAGARLGRVAGALVTMTRDWYAAQISEGKITDMDLAAALSAAPPMGRPADVTALKYAAEELVMAPKALETVADLAAATSGIDWPGIVSDRVGAWAAGYFDEGQALWCAPHGRGGYDAWRSTATHDLTPEIVGLGGFSQFVADAPETSEGAIARAVARLQLQPSELETYLHQLLLGLGGWAQYARYKLWQAELADGSDATLIELLAIRLLWEEALFDQYEEAIAQSWADVRAEHAAPLVPSADQLTDLVLQDAAERAAQRELGKTLASASPGSSTDRPALHAVFCIDVRSEVFRRALESTGPGIRTSGFAGFFGLTAAHRGFASDMVENRLPVLLNPGVTSRAEASDEDDLSQRFSARAARAWGRFKLAAVSSFAFVEAAGPLYAVKLLRDAMGLRLAETPNDPAPRFEPPLDLSTRVTMAESVLRAMSLTDGFARLVVLAGHGATVTNNPHASGLHCGACGGYSGEVNARLLASLLNDADLRTALAGRGIELPDDTLFVGALHDTITDAVTLFDADHPSVAHANDVEDAAACFAVAGRLTRTERALRLPRASTERDIVFRSRDWAETRPEWALAGCKAFIAAPRGRTLGRDLSGRAFLHDYDWRRDRDFGVLELIMTAPVVVASWISLQYYGSTVAPGLFGSGNKLLHNVVGGIGVVEGNGGPMRAGLPWQSVHDGIGPVHEPLRLSVCIEAPREAMTEILARHDGVRALFDNGWLHLFALDEQGRMTWRYDDDLSWKAIPLPEVDPVPLAVAG